MTIEFDGTEIATADYIPQYVKHESAPPRSLQSLSLTREDGAVLVATQYGPKTIMLRGVIRAASQALAETAIDNFKELFSRQEKNLDIAWAGGTRRYVATCSDHKFDRDHWHTNGIPWSAEFTVISGDGKATSASTPINASSITTTVQSDGSYIHTGSFSITGSKPAKPAITLEFHSGTHADMLGIEFKNVDTGEIIIITNNVSWASAELVIDCENKRVLFNDEEIAFYGIFPNFKIGTNNFQITTGGIVNQRSSEDAVSDPEPFVGLSISAIWFAQSFSVPYIDPTFKGFRIGLSKNGTPGGNFFILVQGDNNGEPDGATIGSAVITAGSVNGYTNFEYILGNAGAAFQLEPNTRYWIVMGATAGSGSDRYLIAIPTASRYPRGKNYSSTNSGSTWTINTSTVAFRLLMGGIPKATTFNLTVAYTPTYL